MGKSWKNRQVQKAKQARQQLRGGLDVREPLVTLAKPVVIQQVSGDAFRQRNEMNWSDRLRDAFATNCSDFLTEDAQSYYFSRAPGRQAYNCYLRMDFIIRLSLAMRRKLTLPDMELLVANDGELNSQICVHKLHMGKMEELIEINARRKLHRQLPVTLRDIHPSEDLMTRCRFTPVRWVQLPLDQFIQDRFMELAGIRGNILEVLGTFNNWQYFGSFFERTDPKDPKKKVRLSVSGAPWRFEKGPGQYVPFPGSSLTVMWKSNPAKVMARATIDTDYTNKLYRRHLEDLGKTYEERRDLATQSAVDIWAGDVLEQYDAVIGAATAA
ncbi:MAG: hypothetical protein KW806_02720 [Candidatus Yanofskybacteria bacterium]|nr:hypothetical protein [Candidatus Yanofskybacteria bacterium]